jgi:TolB-like protein/DNA-binding SARP family transcriptional activator/rhodanese-related sulfurtransferase
MDALASSRLRVRLLGGFELSGADGSDLTPPRKMLRALVALLALAPPAGWSREQLTALLWGGRDDEQARGSLRQALAELRRFIGEAVLRADRETVSFDPAKVGVDALEFADLSAAGKLEEAAALYRGDLLEGSDLPGSGFADWLAVERMRLHDAAVDLLIRLLGTQSGEAAIATAQRLLQLDAAHEPTHRRLMRLFAELGDRSQALRQYQVCRDALQRELGVKPEPETERLSQEIQSAPRSVSTGRRAADHQVATDVAVSVATGDRSQDKPGVAPEAVSKPRQDEPAHEPIYSRRWAGRAALLPLLGPKRGWLRIAAIASVLVLGGGMVWLFSPWQAAPAVTPVTIAVLPFDNLSGNPEQSYFADGITEDLITDLSKVSGIFVISRNSSWTYKGKPTTVQQVAKDFGVRYVLEGSVQPRGDAVRINAQLIDAIGDRHLWADRYDGDRKDVFALEDKVIGEIVAALAVKLTSEEESRIHEIETNNPQAYDSVLRGWDHLRQDNEEETLKAVASFERAIELDPDYGYAHASLAAADWRIVLSSWEAATGTGFEHAYQSMMDNLAKATVQKPRSLAFAILAEVLGRQGRYDEAFSAISRAMALAPNDPDNHIALATILNETGRAPEAEREARFALRLDPRFTPGYLRVLAISLFHQERYQEAADTLERVVAPQPSDEEEDYATLAASLGHLGRSDGVQAAVDKFNEISVPAGFDPLTVQEMGWWWYGDVYDYNKVYMQRLLEGLYKAGIPLGAGYLAPEDYLRFIKKNKGEYSVIGVREIGPETAKALNERGVRFIDVRAAVNYERGHIPGAVNLSLPVTLSKESLAQVVGKDDEVVFSCMGKYCPYSAIASAKALAWGYTHVDRLAGGFPAWKDAGYPVAGPSDPPP